MLGAMMGMIMKVVKINVSTRPIAWPAKQSRMTARVTTCRAAAPTPCSILVPRNQVKSVMNIAAIEPAR